MKQTTSINIGGIVLHIDDDAFQQLNEYIRRLEKHFEKDPEKTEILNDIEQRMAELLSEQLSSRERSVNVEHVKKAISIMGNPQDFDNDTMETSSAQSSDNDKKPKHFYRNPEGKIIAGVASGLGVYFNIDPVLIRIGLLILTLVGAGFPVPLYIILWIIIPEAQSRTQKMEMYGESINIDSIKKNAQAGFEDIKSTVRDFAHSSNTKNAVSQMGSFIGKVAPIVFKVVFGLSIAAITTGIIFLLLMEIHPNLVCWGLPPSLDPNVAYFLSRVDVSLLGIGFLLVASAAVTSLFYILPNVIWGGKTSSRVAVQISSALTTIGIIIIIIALTKSVIDYHAVKEFIFYGGNK